MRHAEDTALLRGVLGALDVSGGLGLTLSFSSLTEAADAG